MYCPKCGTLNLDDSRFCEGCGAPLSPSPATSSPVFQPQAVSAPGQPPKPGTPKKPKKPLVWVLVALIVLAGLGLGGWWGWNVHQGNQFQEQLSLGEKYLQELNYEDAVVSLKRAIAIDPKNPQPYLLLADVYVAQEDYPAAVEILEQGYEATGNNEEIAQKQEEVEELLAQQEQREAAERAAAAILAPVVEYQGNAYYWQYQADSVASEGLFSYYPYRSGVENQLVCRSADGTVTPLYTGAGFGDMLLLHDRLYFSDNQTLYSIQLDGSGLQSVENVTLEAADPDNDRIILSSGTSDAPMLESMDAQGNRTPLAEGAFLTLQNGVVYYQLPRATGDNVELGSIHTDGSGQLLLASSPLDDTWGYGGIEGIQILGDTVYYSCGVYSGTANIWQGGFIASVKTDGTGYRVLTEDVLEAAFSVFLSDETPVLRWSNSDYYGDPRQGDSLSACMDLETMTITGSPFPNGSFQEAVTDTAHDVWIYADTSGTPIQLLDSEEGYESLGSYPSGSQDDGKEWKEIAENCYTGNFFYFSVTTSTYDSTLDVGWRSGFRRELTQWYRKDLSTGEVQLLYDY